MTLNTRYCFKYVSLVMNVCMHVTVVNYMQLCMHLQMSCHITVHL